MRQGLTAVLGAFLFVLVVWLIAGSTVTATAHPRERKTFARWTLAAFVWPLALAVLLVWGLVILVRYALKG